MEKRPIFQRATTPYSFEENIVEKRSCTNPRKRSLLIKNENNQKPCAQKKVDLLVFENHNATQVAIDIDKEVADRQMLQAFESRLKGTSRDKESLLEECNTLREALADQHYHLQLHKIHHETLHLKQEKMEVIIKDLEIAHGLKAPRTGDPSHLKARLLGLKYRKQVYFATLTILQDDLNALKKDGQVSLTQEAIAERDVFASETRRLQKIIRQLRIHYHKICEENKEIAYLCKQMDILINSINDAKRNTVDKTFSIGQMKNDIAKTKSDASEAHRSTELALSKMKDLENHNNVLKNMLVRERDETSRIRKQHMVITERIRNIRKENAEKLLKAAASAGMSAANASKKAGKGGKKGQSKGKYDSLSDSDVSTSSSLSPSSKMFGSYASTLPSSPTSPTSTSSGTGLNNEINRIRENYLKSVETAANIFVETAPGSESLKGKPHEAFRSVDDDHSNYERVTESFQKDVSEAEDTFLAMMEKMEYGTVRSRNKSAARGNSEEDTLRNSQPDIKKWLENLTIEIDNKTLNTSDYVVDCKGLKTNVKIKSHDNSPEAIARKKAEKEAQRQQELENEAQRQKLVEELEAAKRKATEETEARRKAEEEVEDAKKKAAEEEVTKRKLAEEETTRRQIADEEAAREKAVEEEARRQKIIEEETRRLKMIEEEEVRRRKAIAEEEARRKKAIEEEEAVRRKRMIEEEEAAAAKRKAAMEDGESGGAGRGRGGRGGSSGEGEFFNEEMKTDIKHEIRDVLLHLETISDTINEKAAASSSSSPPPPPQDPQEDAEEEDE